MYEKSKSGGKGDEGVNILLCWGTHSCYSLFDMSVAERGMSCSSNAKPRITLS